MDVVFLPAAVWGTEQTTKQEEQRTRTANKEQEQRTKPETNTNKQAEKMRGQEKTRPKNNMWHVEKRIRTGALSFGKACCSLAIFLRKHEIHKAKIVFSGGKIKFRKPKSSFPISQREKNHIGVVRRIKGLVAEFASKSFNASWRLQLPARCKPRCLLFS